MAEVKVFARTKGIELNLFGETYRTPLIIYMDHTFLPVVVAEFQKKGILDWTWEWTFGAPPVLPPIVPNPSTNVFVGPNAGDNETGYNKLYIANDDTSTPLIYGEFDNHFLKIWGDLEVSGTINGWTGVPDHQLSDHTDTVATGAELNELRGGGLTALHTHDHSGLDHNSLFNYEVTQHRAMDDATISNVVVWSSTKITTHLSDTITSIKGQPNGLAELDALGKVPSSQIPPIAITEIYVVADIAARDDLVTQGTVQQGDIAIVQSNGITYMWDGVSVWYEMQTLPSVVSVNGYTGVVVIGSDDVAEGVVNLYMTVNERSKLATVQMNANNYIHPVAHAPGIITQDTNNRFVTDAQILDWNTPDPYAYPADEKLTFYATGLSIWYDGTADRAYIETADGKSLWINTPDTAGDIRLQHDSVDKVIVNTDGTYLYGDEVYVDSPFYFSKRLVDTRTTTDNIVMADSGKSIRGNALIPQIFNLATATGADDGATFTFIKQNVGALTIDLDDATATISDSSVGGRIEELTTEIGSTLTIEYVAAINKWVVMSANGAWTTS